MTARRLVRLLLALAAGGVCVLTGLLIAAQSSFGRTLALSWLQQRLASDGIDARVERLEYNLLTLDAGLGGVSLSVSGQPGSPFFAADAIQVKLPARILLGRWSAESIEIVRPRVLLRRASDGTLNWPELGDGAPSTSPGSIDLGTVRVRQLDFSFTDERSSYALDVHSLSFDLPPARTGSAGSLTLEGPARFRRGNREAALQRLAGRVGFDGSDLTLHDVQLGMPTARLQLDGRLGPLFGDPRLAVTCRGSVDLALVSAWIDMPGAPAGPITFAGSLSGPMSEPAIALSLAGDRLSWAGLREISMQSAAAWQSGAIDVSALMVRLAGGELIGQAHIALDDASTAGSSAALVWHRLSLAAIQPAMDFELPVELSASMDGRLDARWREPRAEAVTLTLENRARPVSSAGRLDVDGSVALEVNDGRWQLRVDDLVGGAVRIAGSARGQIGADGLPAATLAGDLVVSASDLSSAWRVMRPLKRLPTGAARELAGQATARLSLGGTLGSPLVSATVGAERVRYGPIGPAALVARGSWAGNRIDIASIELQAGGNSARGAGRMTVDSREIEGRFEAQLSDLSVLSSELPTWGHVSGSSRVAADASGSWSRPRLRVSATGEALTFAGQLVDRWSADLRVEGDAVISVDKLELSQPSGHLTSAGWYNWADRNYAVKLTGQSLSLRPIPRSLGQPLFPVEATISVELDASGPIADPRGAGRLSASAVSWSGYQVGDFSGDFTVRDKSLRVIAQAGDDPIAATATINAMPLGAFVLDLDVDNLDLARWAARLSPAIPVSRGSLIASIQASGDLTDFASMAAHLDLRHFDATVDSAPIRLLNPTRLRYTNHEIEIADAQVQLGDTRLRLGGRMAPESAQTLTASLNGQLDDLNAILPVVASVTGTVMPPLDARGSVRMTLTARGDPARPVLDGALAVRDAGFRVTELPDVTDIALDARYTDETLDFQHVEAVWQGARMVASGRVPASFVFDPHTAGARPEKAHIIARVDSITEALLAPWLAPATLERIEVDLAGSITVEADRFSLGRARGEIELQRAQTTVGGIALGQTRPTRLAIADGQMRIVDWEWAGPGSRVVLRGGAQLDPRLQLDVTTDSTVDLTLLGAFLPDIGTAGQARLVVHAHGPADAPELDGRIDVTGAELRMADPRIIVTGLTGTLTLGGDRATTENMEGSANGGTLRLSGSLSYGDLRQPRGSLSIEGRGTALDLKGLQTELDTNVILAKIDGRATLSGLVNVRRGAYREPLSLAGGLLLALRQQDVLNGAASSSVMDTIDLNVRVTSADDLLVDNNYARLQMGADVRLVGTLGHPALVGRAAVREGGQIFLGGNTYRIVGDGSIDFADSSRITPDVSITALTRVSSYDVTLSVRGTPDTLRTDLGSDPPLGQTDLVSLLLTGRTLEQAGGAALTVPREQVLGYLSGEVLGVAGRAVGLDTVRIERGLPDVQFNAGLVATETDPGSRLTFAKNVTPDLQLIFSQSLKQTGGLTWIVSYAVRRNIEARAVTRDNGDRSYDFRHDVSVGGPTTTLSRAPRTEPERIVAIRFTGDSDVTRAQLLDRLKLERGDRFDFFTWQDDRDRLEEWFAERGFYEARVTATRITATEPVAGIALDYDVQRGPATRLVVEGYGLPSRVLRAMKTVWTRAAFDQFLLEEIRATALKSLAARGYLRATLEAAIEQGPGTKRVVLRIASGPRTPERRIQPNGNKRIDARRLEAYLRSRDLLDEAWTDPVALAAALRSLYRDEGMLAASVGVRPPVFDGRSAVLPVEIVEGPVFRIGRVTLEGVKALPEDGVRAALQLEPGATYSPVEVARARQRLEARYRKEGFNAVAVRVATNPDGVPSAAAALGGPGGALARVDDDASHVDVSVAVTEGPRHVLREVVAAGAVRTDSRLISRALQLDIGLPVDLAEWSLARNRLYDTGVFRRVDIEEEPLTPQPAAESAASEEPVRAKVTLEEWPPLRVRYGVQINDETKPASDTRQVNLGVSGDLTYRNVLGRAASTGLAGRYDSDLRVVRGFLTTPSLLRYPITSNLFVSRSREHLGQASTRPFVTDKVDLTAEQRVRPWGRLELAYSYSYQRNHTFDLHPKPDDPFAFDLTVDVARLRGTALLDARDDLVDATRGWFHSSNIEYAAAGFGSDVRFAKYVLQQYYYRSLPGRVVLASAGRLGVAAGFGQQLIPSERFLAGGPTSVRGYAQDALGPVDVFGSVAGGDALLVLNEEVRFPVFKWFRGVGFFDAGNAFGSVGDLSLRDLRSSTGLGVRIQTPFALLRVDLGMPVNRRPGEAPRRWMFSVGQVF